MAWAVSPAALAASPIAVSAEGSGSTMGAGLATSEAPQRTRQLCWQRRSGLVTDLCSGLRGMLSDNGKVEALVSMPCLMVASAPSRQRVGSSLEPNEASPVDSPLQPAHSLAVQAFKHEEESAKSLKRREHLEQDKCGNDDPNPTELSRGKSVRFLFAVFYRVTIKVGKRLRYLTKHPHSGIQAMATDLFGYWKKVVLEETGKKNGSSENERSNNSASRVEKAQPMKVEKNSASASVKVEKRDVDVRGQKPESVKVEKIANNDSKAQPVKVERVSKEVSRTPDTKKPSSVPNGPPKLTSLVKSNDATRDKIRELLADAFSRVSGETSKDDREEVRNILDEVDACDPFRVSVTVESALFERLGRSTGAHKAKYRSIMFNLRADNNTDFRRRVLLGQVRPERLVDISPEEMASDARKLENKQIKEKALFDCERGGAPKATTDQFKCGRCGQRKTTYYQLQTRSADEPMTTFVTCVNCNNHWKFC